MPRPIRRVLLGSAAVSCLIASALAVTQLIQVSCMRYAVAVEPCSARAVHMYPVIVLTSLQLTVLCYADLAAAVRMRLSV